MALGSRAVKSDGAVVIAAATRTTALAPITDSPPRKNRGRRIGGNRGAGARSAGPPSRASALAVHVVVAERDAVAEVHEALDVLAGDELVDDAPVHHLRGV